MKQVHPGMVDDNDRPENFLYGRPTGESEHVDSVIKAQNLAGLADYHNDLKESQYQSHLREPLGKSYVRGHKLPNDTQNEKFSYGVATVGSESAKEVLYPARDKDEN